MLSNWFWKLQGNFCWFLFPFSYAFLSLKSNFVVLYEEMSLPDQCFDIFFRNPDLLCFFSELKLTSSNLISEKAGLTVADFVKNRGGIVQNVIEIMNQTFLTHVVNYFAGSVKCALAFTLCHVKHIFENLAKHFRINRNLFFKRLILFYGKVIPVKNIKNPCSLVTSLILFVVMEESVRQIDDFFLPLVISFKETSVQKRNFAVKALVITRIILIFALFC